jgi:hypothetical protein
VLCGKIIVESGAFAGDLKDGRFASPQGAPKGSEAGR